MRPWCTLCGLTIWCLPLDPRNPKQLISIGKAKDEGEGKYMHIHSTIRLLMVRSVSLLLVVIAMSAASFGQFRVAITVGPPALPVYEQPICPGDGYLWTPGYWYWDDDAADYYWVPGTWVLAPEVGFLWTPGWWGWGGSAFLFHQGYWGPQVGFYGGINYGFGYFGAGFAGGRWDGGHFFYNRAVLNINVTNIHNVYNTTVVNNTVINRVSYNGHGGIEARPTPQEEAAEHDRHIPAVAAQNEHVQAARGNPQLRASVNHGRPSIAATERPGAFSGHGVVEAKEAGAPYRAEENHGAAGSPARPAIHPNDLPRAERPAAPNTGNANLDRKYQQQQDKLVAKQSQERQKLQQKQDQEHQQLARQKADDARTQQVEQKHQQQTQQLQQRHTEQVRSMQAHQAPAGRR